MNLNLPIYDQLSGCKNILIAGMGGGFDIFCGLPIYWALRERGQIVHLANFSFSAIEMLANKDSLNSTLVGVTADDSFMPYFPELHLSRWFRESAGEEQIIWAFHKTGVQPLLENYRLLIKHLSIDGILLIDGGVDSLVRGDEFEMGTVLEDATSLAAVNELTDVPVRLMACIGFGIERDMAYGHIFENVAYLTEIGAFLGSCSLTRQMACYQRYEEAVLYAQKALYQDSSVINSSIISAVRGHFGDFHLTDKTRGGQMWISPLMPIYWFFDLPVVASQNLFLTQIVETETFIDVFRAVTRFRNKLLRTRPHFLIPLK